MRSPPSPSSWRSASARPNELRPPRPRRVRWHHHRLCAPRDHRAPGGGALRDPGRSGGCGGAPLRGRAAQGARRALDPAHPYPLRRAARVRRLPRPAPHDPRRLGARAGAEAAHPRAPRQRRVGAGAADGKAYRPLRRDRRRLPARAQSRRAAGGGAGAEGADGGADAHRALAHRGAGADRGGARPFSGGHDPLQAPPLRRLHHRCGWRHLAHRHRRPQPRYPGDRRPAPRLPDHQRARADHCRRGHGRGDRQPRPGGAGRIQAAPIAARPRAREAEAPEVQEGHDARWHASRALRQYRAARGHARSARGRRGGRGPLPQRVHVPQPQGAPERGRAVRGLSQRGAGDERAAGGAADAGPRRRQSAEQRRPDAEHAQPGDGPACDPLLSRRAADVPDAAAGNPARLALRQREDSPADARARARDRADPHPHPPGEAAARRAPHPLPPRDRDRRHDRNPGRGARPADLHAAPQLPVDRDQRPHPVHPCNRPHRRRGGASVRPAASSRAHAGGGHDPDRHARRRAGRGVRRNGRRPAAHATAPRPRAAQFLDASLAAPAYQGTDPAHQPRRGAGACPTRAARERPGEDQGTACPPERLRGISMNWLLSIILALSAFSVQGQSYPSKPVKLVVPFPAGSATDQVARLIGAQLQEALRQPFIVENKAGAQGGIAAAEVARTAPDGYTLMVTTNTPQAANVSLFKKLNYDPVKDFAPIARLGTTSFMLMVRPDFPAKDLKAFLDQVRKQPGKLSAGYGSAGSQVSLAMLKAMGKLDVVEVPYKGIPQSVTDTMGGSLAFTFVDLGNALAQAKGGKLRGLGVTSAKRTPLASDQPAIAEALPGYELIAWFALVAPAKTPRDVVQKIHSASLEALKKSEVKEKFATIGVDVAPMGPAELGQFIQSEIAHWAKLVKLANIQPE